MNFIVEFDEWTESAWMRRTSEPLDWDNALYWMKYMVNQGVVKVRNVTMRQHDSVYGDSADVLVL